jgi:hypothetical protein
LPTNQIALAGALVWGMVRAAHALAPKLPCELVRLVMAHGAASVVQRCARRRLGRRVRTAMRRARRVAQQERAVRYIASFAFGGDPVAARSFVLVCVVST